MANIIVTVGNHLAIQGESPVVTAVVKPGFLLERATGGVKPHATAGEGGTPIIATEKNAGHIGGDQDSTYAEGDQASYSILPKGAQLYGWLASGQNVAALAVLTSDGAGALAALGEDEVPVFRAMEAVNATSATKRILVEVI